MRPAKLGTMVLLSGILLAGCAGNGESELHQLNRQQSATIESLSAEIQKLNRELDETVRGRENLEAAEPKLERLLTEAIRSGDANVSMERSGMVVTIRERTLFAPDEIFLTPAGAEILEPIASLLSGELSGQKVSVEGHTDDRPVEGPEGVTNWEYSIDRAMAVLHYFTDVQKLEPQRFSVSGFGEYRPVASNEAEEGRARNRRVSIVISPQNAASAGDPEDL